MSFVSIDEKTRREMLREIGVDSFESLIKDIPESLRIDKLPIDNGLCEMEVLELIKASARKNAFTSYVSYLGAGVYDHYVPAVVDALASRPEYVTAYTPYQAEASQGYLQAIYEYQTAIARLTGMDCSNASHYDGATSLCEAVKMACASSGKNNVCVSLGLNPQYRDVMNTYFGSGAFEIIDLPLKNGATEANNASIKNAGAVVLQYPNFYGAVEDIQTFKRICEPSATPLIASAYPLALGVLRSPGELGADICTGDAQSLGCHPSFGGPHLGFITCRKEYMRKLPGRIVGKTIDKDAKEAYCLTLQAREQHIRREKASSNICSNQALMAFRALVFMMYYGEKGFKKLAEGVTKRARYLYLGLKKIKGVTMLHSQEFFNEFVICAADINKIYSHFMSRSIIPGLIISKTRHGADGLLVCVTEKHDQNKLDTYIAVMKEALRNV